MGKKETFWTNTDLGLLLLRLVFAGTFVLHGINKLRLGIAEETQILIENGLPGPLMYFVYVSELVAPVLILFGVFTRISILTVVATMLVILYVLPFPIGFGPHGELNIESHLYFTFVPLALFFTGPGRYRLRKNNSGNWLLD